MAETAETHDRRYRRVYTFWAVGLGLLAALALACWLVVTPFLKIRAVAEETGRSGQVPADAVERLGGRRRAAAAIGLYFRVPHRLAPDRIEACCVLSHCGPHIMPVLRLALADADPNCRVTALQLAAHMGHHGTGAMPQAIELLCDQDREVRYQAATMLGTMAAAWAPGPAIRRQPTAWAHTHRYSSGGFLQGLKPPAFAPFDPGAASKPIPMSRETVGRVVAGLADAISDSDQEVRAAAAQALLGHMPDAVEAVPGLVRALEAGDEPTRTNATALLAEIGPGAAAARPALTRYLRDPSETVRQNAVIALGRIVTDKSALRETLKPVVGDESEAIRKTVAETLGRKD